VSGAAVVVDRVSKSFEGGTIRALDESSFRLAPGDFAALTGPSGSGKSTLLNLIGALDTPDAGRIEVDGRDIAQLDGAEYRAETVGFVFQFHHLVPTLSALENVQVPMLGRGRPRGERVERAHELLADVGLEHRMDARPGVLSGGERQRVAVARALANAPRLLLADEPTGALDSDTGLQVLALLERIRADHAMTVLLVTNDEDLARAADRTLRLRDGRVNITPAAAPQRARA
jgi:putative ABC transport system ATP-binding protein